MKNAKVGLIVMVLVLSLTVAACGKKQSSPAGQPDPQKTESAATPADPGTSEEDLIREYAPSAAVLDLSDKYSAQLSGRSYFNRIEDDGGCAMGAEFARDLEGKDLDRSTQAGCAFLKIVDCGPALHEAEFLKIYADALIETCHKTGRGSAEVAYNLVAVGQRYRAAFGLPVQVTEDQIVDHVATKVLKAGKGKGSSKSKTVSRGKRKRGRGSAEAVQAAVPAAPTPAALVSAEAPYSAARNYSALPEAAFSSSGGNICSASSATCGE